MHLGYECITIFFWVSSKTTLISQLTQLSLTQLEPLFKEEVKIRVGVVGQELGLGPTLEVSLWSARFR
jgi:hypothetical protein